MDGYTTRNLLSLQINFKLRFKMNIFQKKIKFFIIHFQRVAYFRAFNASFFLILDLEVIKFALYLQHNIDNDTPP